MRSSDASTNTAQTRTRSRYGWRRSNAQGAPMTTMLHPAQLNIGRIRHPLDDPRMADFVNNLDRVNAIAEHTPGFVWRLQDDSGNATAIHAFDDPRMLLNMSVWESVEALERFVWQTVHKRDRKSTRLNSSHLGISY